MRSPAPSSLFDRFSHDLKSPLANIQANVFLIRHKLSQQEKEKVTKHLETIEAKVQEVNRVLLKISEEEKKSIL